MIPNAILDKYNIGHEEGMWTEQEIAQEFLNRTDYEIIKGFEGLFTEPSSFLVNFVKLAINLTELCRYRAIARELLKEKQ